MRPRFCLSFSLLLLLCFQILRVSAASPAHQIQYTPWDLVLALAWSPDGSTLAVSAGETLHLYRGDSLEEVASLDLDIWTPALSFSKDSSRLATGGRDGSIRIWDPDSGKLLKTLEAHPKGVNSLQFSPDGRLLASSGNDGMVRIWDLETEELFASLIGGVYAVPDIAFSLDGGLLITADGRYLRLREVATQRLANSLSIDPGGSEASFFTLDLSPDGRLLASGSTANTVHLWDLDRGELLNSIDAHAGRADRVVSLVWSVVFSPDGRWLASGGGDAFVRLWEVSSGKLLEALDGHSLAVTCLAFSPDGSRLASGSLDGTVQIWSLR